MRKHSIEKGALGRVYQDGEFITRQGDVGQVMYVIQQGKVEVLMEKEGRETLLRVAEEGEFLGEMAIFDHEVRSASLRAKGEVKVLTIDKKNFLKRIHVDPSLAFRIVQTMSQRVRELGDEVARLKG
ncbi:MAG: cyclic nucleotide-binding domain-containing protein [Thermoanaerobaculia bacterium]